MLHGSIPIGKISARILLYLCKSISMIIAQHHIGHRACASILNLMHEKENIFAVIVRTFLSDALMPMADLMILASVYKTGSAYVPFEFIFRILSILVVLGEKKRRRYKYDHIAGTYGQLLIRSLPLLIRIILFSRLRRVSRFRQFNHQIGHSKWKTRISTEQELHECINLQRSHQTGKVIYRFYRELSSQFNVSFIRFLFFNTHFGYISSINTNDICPYLCEDDHFHGHTWYVHEKIIETKERNPSKPRINLFSIVIERKHFVWRLRVRFMYLWLYEPKQKNA